MTSSEQSPYEALHARFAATSTPFVEIEHEPAAAARDYHRIVGSRLEQQAKALLFRRYNRDGRKDYFVYALPGDASADLETLTKATGASRLRLATRAELEQQTACRFGELPPLGSIFGLELILDPRLLAEAKLYFNAGRLDRSFIVAAHNLAVGPPGFRGDCFGWFPLFSSLNLRGQFRTLRHRLACSSS